MKNQSRVRAVAATGIFVLGFLCGSVAQRPAQAQWKELGGEVVKQAGQQGGALGSATQLGSAIVDMEGHVSALQKNLDTLKKIKAALGG